jgi:hypothetical protein
MRAPEVPIDVDPETGIWRTDGLAMIYLPRHFLVNNHLAVEAALGRDAYRAILHGATEKSAVTWCRSEAKTHGLSPEVTFRHYFHRLSQRGWGRFSVDLLDVRAGRCRISLWNSVFALEARPESSPPLCYMFEGFIAGAFKFLREADHADGEPKSTMCDEVHCAGEGTHPHCTFDLYA